MEALRSGQDARGFSPSALLLPTTTVVAEMAVAAETPIPVAATVVPVEPTTVALTPTLLVPTPQVSSIPEATFVLPTPPQMSNEQRWRAQQINRNVFDLTRSYTTASSELWWYDPVNQQHVILGTFTGDFLAQAQFTLRGQGIEALEVPYQVNVNYGLTALSPALVARINAAGAKDWVETYVFITPNVVPR